MRLSGRALFIGLAALVTAGGATAYLLTDRSPRLLRSADAIEVTPLKTYGRVHAQILLWLADVRGIDIANPVDCYRIVYPSRDGKGRAIRLSGLLALPRGVEPRALVSYQHGTSSDPRAAPSNLDTEGLAAALVFAGNGYAVLAPDYIGLGVSKPPHPYFVAEDTARAVVDLIAAARRVPGVPQSVPILIGFSEGGYASLAAQRALEESGQSVRGTAAIAGAFNLRKISIPWTLEGRSPQASTYLALWVRGYALRYGHPLHSAFTAHYATLVPELLDTPHTTDQVLAALPTDPRRMFRADLLAAVDGKGSHWLVDALAANEMGDWAPRAPIRLYFGDDDVDVPPADSKATATQLSARGGDVRAIDVGPADHFQSIVLAAPQILDWLKTLTSATILPLRRRG
ncbi:MAG: alpha/beta fold hydrolase [Proteobacteria bacterium]|nr:alpha/beta fold hydrolase [Pseudomonadota bacterium]